MTATYADVVRSMDLADDADVLLDISEFTENLLQDDHEREFVAPRPRLAYVDRCVTCNDNPIWSCAIKPCDEKQSCFVQCPSCGRNGNSPAVDGWEPDTAFALSLKTIRS